MEGKRLQYQRLKKGYSLKQLSEISGFSQARLSNYENGIRQPDDDTLEKLAEALGVSVFKFFGVTYDNLKFTHKAFYADKKLSKIKQEFICSSVEEYIQRFWQIIDFLGEDVLSRPLKPHTLPFSGDSEKDAIALRSYLPINQRGPISNLIDQLEKVGILFCFLDIEDTAFFGRYGFVNEYPYIAVNQNMKPEQIRQTIAHELVHIFFQEPEDEDTEKIERVVTEISEAFLFPKEDAIQELGIKRHEYGEDMILVSKKYGISAYTLVNRAYACGILNKSLKKEIITHFNKLGWKHHEPSRIPVQKSDQFFQLVTRAICEDKIGLSKGAELLQIPHIPLIDKIKDLESAVSA